MIPWEDILRLLAAAVAGGVIGFERERHDKPAGLRTNMMICVGAALFTVLSHHMATPGGDPARVAAQVVTGVGFLGAGAIIQARGNVFGLTTAATIWVVASVGMAFGAGYYLLGVAVTIAVAVILALLGDLLDHWAFQRTSARFQIEMGPDPEGERHIRRQIESAGLRAATWQVSKTAEGLKLRTVVQGRERRIERLQDVLLTDERVRAFDRR